MLVDASFEAAENRVCRLAQYAPERSMCRRICLITVESSAGPAQTMGCSKE